MSIYETVFVLRGDLTTSQVDETKASFKTILEDGKAKVYKEESWGLRTLAYKIKKNRKGHYVLFEMEAEPAAVAEFERKMGLNENVLRFINIKRDARSTGQSPILKEEEKRYDKR